MPILPWCAGRGFLSRPVRIILAGFILIALISMNTFGTSQVALAKGQRPAPPVPHLKHSIKSPPHHKGKGINRRNLSVLPHYPLNSRTGRARSAQKQKAPLIEPNVDAGGTTTLFFDDMETGGTGWSVTGDTRNSSIYPNGHTFWNLIADPGTLQVPTPTINPNLVVYPDAAGMLPAARSGNHIWGYNDTPAVDPSYPGSASLTYMGNQSDWPGQSGQGGQSNGPNSASLISPAIDLTATNNATLTFATWWEIESVNPAHFDMMYVDVSKNGGSSWDTLGVLNPTNNPDGGQDAYPYSDNGLDAPASWQITSVDLSPYSGSSIKVRFRFDTVDQYDNGFRGWFIDDVGVYSSQTIGPRISALSSNSGTAGDTITLTGTGFGAQQGTGTVTFNGTAATIKSWSDTAISVIVPGGATSGPLVVTVNGVQSASQSFTITAAITLSSPTISPRMVDTLSGRGFAANEPVGIYLNGITGTLLTTINADANGTLPATSLNIADMPAGNYLLLAHGSTSSVTAGTMLSILPRLALSTNVVQPGQAITITAVGFAANEYLQFSVDTPNNQTFYSAYADAQGSFTASVPFLSASITNGSHMILGVGYSSALIAESPITVIPQITLNVTSGGPGTYSYLSGSGFAARETVQISCNSESTSFALGSAITDASGNLSFSINIPVGIAAGDYTITATRNNRTPATANTTFTVVPPAISASSGILSGQSVTFFLKGFQAYETVALKWDANGGQQITTVSVDSTGAASSTVTPGSAPNGSYTLSATGSTSNLIATTPLSVGPGSTVNSANPGGVATVQGGGFTPGEIVNLIMTDSNNTAVTTPVQATVDNTGAFSAQLTVPTSYQTTLSYTINANSTTGTNSASAPFTFTPPQLSLSTLYPYYGQQVTITGKGFLTGEAVSVSWEYGQNGHIQVATATAAADGSFSMTVLPPSIPSADGYSYQAVNVVATGGTSQLTAKQTSVYQYAAMVLNPTSGAPGTLVQVSGGDFGAGDTVNISYQGSIVATVTADTSGAFTTNVSIPSTAIASNVTFQAANASGSISVNASFKVTPAITITPTSGVSGTSITITGQSFNSSNTVYIYWYDPVSQSSSYLSAATSSADGTLNATITVPGGLTTGNTYYVQAYDAYSGTTAQAAFVAS